MSDTRFFVTVAVLVGLIGLLLFIIRATSPMYIM